MSEKLKSLPGDWTDPLEKIMTLQSQLAALKLENQERVEEIISLNLRLKNHWEQNTALKLANEKLVEESATPVIITTKGHNLGDQTLTFRMAANAIWNKLNICLSLDLTQHRQQLQSTLREARAIADSIVQHPKSGYSYEEESALRAEIEQRKNGL